MFIDTAVLTLTAGKGGNGIVAWRREKFVPKGGPAGGNGSAGGSILLKASSQHYSLEHYRNLRHIKAQNGGQGGPNKRQGKKGEDLLLSLPLGTLVKKANTDEILFDLIDETQKFTICRGGRGGKGNAFFRSSTHQAPHKWTEGTVGESKEVIFELKLIADIGLVGMPNAGKSTLISKLTRAPVKIAPYPFTTLRPNLGIMGENILIADIPGIIQGAHNNRGLGLSFLKHVERTRALLFVIDIAGSEGRDPIEDFILLRKELHAYSLELLQKPFFIALNKADLNGAHFNYQRFIKAYPYDPATLFFLSAETKQGIAPLVKAITEMVQAKGPTLRQSSLKQLR